MRLIPDFSNIQLSRREKIMILAGALVVSLVAADRLVWSPWRQYGRKLDKSLSELSMQAQGQEMLLSRQASVRAEVAAYKDFIHPSRSPELEMAEFLREIEELGRQSNVSLPEIKPLPTNASQYFTEFGLEVRFEAGLLDWMKFVYQTESSHSLFVIDKASAARADANSEMLKGSMQIRKMVLNDDSIEALK
ncbi:MAG TPA: hypothetical protein VL688_06310 [Verrucomicrobiae bacterium]|jgi:hypothetical protein|nr:hypothetical protein [Verrucomicrobiae bacterium]